MKAKLVSLCVNVCVCVMWVMEIFTFPFSGRRLYVICFYNIQKAAKITLVNVNISLSCSHGIIAYLKTNTFENVL